MEQGLYVHKTIAIEATADKIWRVLTDPFYTEQWVSQFGLMGGRLVSSWLVGDNVWWIDNNGSVVVDGRVIDVEPESRLHFTVVDRKQPYPTTNQDGITFHIISTEDGAELTVQQGDFSKIPGGPAYHAATAENWDKALPTIKDLAEKL